MRLPIFIALPALALAAPRPLTLDDMHKFKEVGDPRCSPDGKWIAYTLSTVNEKDDKRDTDIWLVSTDGRDSIRVTSSAEAETAPRFSPDGRHIAFLSGRPGPGTTKGNQIWLLDRRGGEAQQITETKSRITGFEWAPDSKRMAVILRDEEDDIRGLSDKDREKPRPIVIDRYTFKRDGAGYLSGSKRSRMNLLDIETKKFETLTTTDFDEQTPSWSPDGTRIAFVSNHSENWDRVPTSDIFVVDAKPNSIPRRLTTFPGPDTNPAWSPDGKWIAYLKGSDHGFGEYNLTTLAVVPSDGSAPPRLLTQALDRGVQRPEFTPDGRTIRFTVADDMSVHLAGVAVTGGAVERLTPSGRVVSSWDQAGSCVAALAASDNVPNEVFVLDNGSLRKLTSHNDALLAGLQLGATEEVRFRTKDGTDVHGLLTKPTGYETGKKYPMLLRIHGGPNAQDQHAFQFERQLFAAQGFAVLNVNYRGSAGRGQQYTVSIAKEWGHKEVMDLLAGVDHAVGIGIADPDRLGVGGWSYGGILTNYLIATTTRFKAATSGAGVSFPLAFYGHDQYIRQYDNELGPPWKVGLDPWVKISYPFLHADRIKTPTLFLCGDKDFNVPLLGSEQMYQALRNVGTESKLVIYPGENHGIARPSFQRDRMQRYLDWYSKHLKQAVTSSN